MKIFHLKLLLVIGISTLLFVGLTVYLFNQSYSWNLALQQIQEKQFYFQEFEKLETQKLSAALSMLADNQALKAAFLKQDKEALYQLAWPLFEKLKQNNHITHWYFHLPTPSQKNFLRVHNRNKNGDTITRATYLMASKQKQEAAGKELGKTAFALRVVHPWFDQGKLIGYLELGQEIDALLEALQQKNEQYDVIALKKYLDQEKWAQVRTNQDLRDNWADNPHLLQVSHVQAMTPDLSRLKPLLESSVKQAQLLGIQRMETGEIYSHGLFPLYDASNNKAGAVVVWIDISQQLQLRWNIYLSLWLVLGLLILLVFAGFLKYFLLNPIYKIEYLAKIIEKMTLGDFNAELVQNNALLKASGSGDLLLQAVDNSIASTLKLKTNMQATIAQTRLISAGQYDTQLELLSRQDQLSQSLNEMMLALQKSVQDSQQKNWLETGHSQLNATLRGEQDMLQLAKKTIQFLCTYLDAKVGTFFIAKTEYDKAGTETEVCFQLIASYAYSQRKTLANHFKLGESLVGQAALEQQTIVIKEPPADYIQIQSGLGKTTPGNILVIPFIYENNVKGVIELGFMNPLSVEQETFLEQAMPVIAITINLAQSQTQTQTLLEQSQAHAKILQEQSEELQSQSEELQTQQEELRQTNEELEERTHELERQRQDIGQQNQQLEETKKTLETKALELERASKYKSEFLANMSHELRTPLNSLLILSKMLADNKPHNLNDKQVQHAKTIHRAGNDLLTLINEILDLSKVEAGRMEVNPEDIMLTELMQDFEHRFDHVAAEKHINYQIELDEAVSEQLHTDRQRLQQILNNLLSNAFKFTPENGKVILTIHPVSNEPEMLAIAVQDSGIGIPADKQAMVFEAFQQADGTTSRRFGGTGLGLSISRELAGLLGGRLALESAEDKGSTFTLYLPQIFNAATTASVTNSSNIMKPPASTENASKADPEKPIAEIQAAEEVTAPSNTPQATAVVDNPDDRAQISELDKVLLVIEDDPGFSQILLDLAHEKDYKCLLAEDGKTGLQLAEDYHPAGVILDVGLPQVDGLTVMERLKENAKTRHIPVHFISASNQGSDARDMGAVGYLLKPVNLTELSEAFKKIEHFSADHLKNLLIVAKQAKREAEISKLAGGDGIHTKTCADMQEAWEALQAHTYDCMVIDLEAAEQKQLQQLAQQQKTTPLQIPVIIYANREFSQEETQYVEDCNPHLTVKTVRSPERLLDETSLFLHQLEAGLPDEKRELLRMVHDKEAILQNKQVLIVDDDIRNLYALSHSLEEKNMEVFGANNGKEALALLEENLHINIVIMDIMMPEMDGYETMRAIRADSRFYKLPIIALTAKAMKADKAKCIDAGANDYLAKPTDMDKLLTLLRVWLYQ
ncbi:response regulator [Candidatus Venteria ishoeyi]|uniref:response regulator n=1 Tax=Candidatus Venteria ishoeyi TaxID=1899563 RepID=UPI0025A68F89|nr:response regulator [Candidatus Venteria ishoeyi]MDM8546058.1 response regulator [Candidatus Venteria ishoeyi]